MQQDGPKMMASAVAERGAQVDYVVDMIHQLAHIARDAGDVPMAIHLEAIIAARRATAPDRPARRGGRPASR